MLTKAVSIKSMDAVDGGEECQFYIMNNKGLKAYFIKSRAKFAFRTQRKLSKAGLAPKVLSDLHEIYDSKYKRKYFGFYTELADTTRQATYSTIKRLETKLKPFGMHHDVHCKNVGKLGRKFVLVDCGPYSNTPYENRKFPS